MKKNEPDNVKQAWTTPRLIVHGTVEELTQQQNKTLGPTDGFTFNGAPIMNAS